MSDSENSSSPVYDINTWPNSAAAVILFLSSCIGIFFNFSIIYNFITEKNQKTAFNLICVFRSFNNIYILSIVMLGVFFPESILGFSIYPPLVESIIITSGVNLMVYNEFQSIYIAVNRLFAILFPVKYNFIFGFKLTFFLHILYYLDRIRNLTMEHFDRYRESNYMLFSTEHLAYGGNIVAPDGMFIWALGLVIFPFLINIITFIRFYHLKKKTSQESEHWKKAKQNMIQFLQTVFQDSLFSISVISSMKLNTLVDHRFWTFLTQTFAWQVIHVLDGFIMKMFKNNKKVLKSTKINKICPIGTAGRGVDTSTVAAARVIIS
uniref:7TM_GPCR_Srx domain-containing protein n=1 Tax=Caenorhabditis tropicalis TaxID=1561998 RepID=A0A1I7U863_9PELO